MLDCNFGILCEGNFVDAWISLLSQMLLAGLVRKGASLLEDKCSDCLLCLQLHARIYALMRGETEENADEENADAVYREALRPEVLREVSKQTIFANLEDICLTEDHLVLSSLSLVSFMEQARDRRASCEPRKADPR